MGDMTGTEQLLYDEIKGCRTDISEFHETIGEIKTEVAVMKVKSGIISTLTTTVILVGFKIKAIFGG